MYVQKVLRPCNRRLERSIKVFRPCNRRLERGMGFRLGELESIDGDKG